MRLIKKLKRRTLREVVRPPRLPLQIRGRRWCQPQPHPLLLSKVYLKEFWQMKPSMFYMNQYVGCKWGPGLESSTFFGLHLSEFRSRCVCCETVTSREEKFLDLSVDITGDCTVRDCLRQFSAREMLNGADKFFCDQCQTRQEAFKRCFRPLSTHTPCTMSKSPSDSLISQYAN